MSSSYLSTLTLISQQIVTYMGLTTVIMGVIGNFLSAIVFLSLKTFRENSCAFYLTVMSCVNIGQLITGQLSRVMITGFNNDWVKTSSSYCKFRYFALEVFSLISFTCVCLAIIDQFLATCVRAQWQRYSNINLARRSTAVVAVICILYSIPYLIFYDRTTSSTGVTCAIINGKFQQFHNYMSSIILTGVLPLLITVIFGGLAYRNIQQIAYRTVPLVRRELDKQLTNMVLVQIFFSSLVALPFVIGSVLPYVTDIYNYSDMKAQFILSINIAACLYYWYFACPFYIYVCVSDRFRRQLIYVLFDLHLNRCRKPRGLNNQIFPQLT